MGHEPEPTKLEPEQGSLVSVALPSKLFEVHSVRLWEVQWAKLLMC